MSELHGAGTAGERRMYSGVVSGWGGREQALTSGSTQIDNLEAVCGLVWLPDGRTSSEVKMRGSFEAPCMEGEI